MGMTEETKKLLHQIRQDCNLLAEGYDEKVEYKVPVAYHRDVCPIRAKAKTSCECPVVNEDRVRWVKRPGLLGQLKNFQQNKDVDRNPKAARGAPRVKKPKMHPELAGFFTLDEICAEAYTVMDKVLEEGGRDRSWAAQNVVLAIAGLPGQLVHFAERRPDLIATTAAATGGWRRKAEGALRLAVSDSIFEGTVCGNCGGALSVPWSVDGDSEVRCIGTGVEPPCGETYPVSEWVRLAKGRNDDR